MKNEEFDEAIRNKLEGLNQSYTDSDIDKVHQQVLKKSRFLRKGSSESWLLYSLSAAAFTVATLWSVSHFRSEKQVVLVNDSISMHIVPLLSDSVQISDDTSVVRGIFSKETEVIKTYNAPIINSGMEAGKSQTQPVKQNKSVDQISAPVQNITITQTQDKSNAAQPADQPAAKPENIVIQPIIQPDNQPQLTHTVTHDETLRASNTIDSTKKIQATPLVLNIPEERDINRNAVTTTGTVPSQNTPASDTLPEEKTGRKEGTHLMFFRDLKIRAGAEFQISNQSIAPGVNGELLFGRHFGFQTGLNYRIYQKEHFTDQKDFFNHKPPPSDHHHWIDDHLSGKDHISDVTISNNLLQVPVIFSYYLPLKHNYTLSFSLGTDLDVYLHQKLSYTDNADTGKHHRDDYQNKGEVSLFNTFTFSAGASKQWKSWLAEVKPYISPRFTEVFYKPKEMEFGLVIGVKYCFGK